MIMEVLSNLFYFLIIGVLVLLSEEIEPITAPSTPAPTTVATTSETSSTENPTSGTTTETPIVPGQGMFLYCRI